MATAQTQGLHSSSALAASGQSSSSDYSNTAAEITTRAAGALGGFLVGWAYGTAFGGLGGFAYGIMGGITGFFLTDQTLRDLHVQAKATGTPLDKFDYAAAALTSTGFVVGGFAAWHGVYEAAGSYIADSWHSLLTKPVEQTVHGMAASTAVTVSGAIISEPIASGLAAGMRSWMRGGRATSAMPAPMPA